MTQATHQKYPRDVAVRVLTRVLSEHQALDEALAGISGEAPPEARGWLQETCSGTLRWKGRLDRALDSVALKKKPSGWLRKALLVGAYQLIVQERTNPGRVVSETVAEIKKKEGEAPAKFANAVLRKIGVHAAAWRELPFRQGAEIPEASLWASLPEWMWAKFKFQNSPEWACAYAVASLERPVLWIRAHPGKGPDWKPEWPAEAGPVPGSWKVLEGGSVLEKQGFKAGEFFVQDISSQLLVHEISTEVKRALAPAAGVAPAALDLCAAPGGKSAGLSWSGFKVTSTDRDGARVALLKQTVERVATGIDVIARDQVAALPEQDLVWVDAPCSGTGILRRHPDVRWLRQEKELLQLLPLQQELLREAWSKVRPGGFLAYSVCSVLREEGPQAIEKAGLKAQVVREWRLLPHEAPHGDGFWAALVRKPE